jgi:hypothetical protein
VRERVELLEQAELVEQPQRRGMHGVAAEVSEEVRVLFQHCDVHPAARQQ